MPAARATGQGSVGAAQNRVYLDQSGAGTGPFAECVALLDGGGNIIAPSSSASPTATMTKPSDATAYAAGDIIANSLTAASVVPLTFANALKSLTGSGRLMGARCVVTPASGNLVITNFAFDLLVFRPGTNIPFAAAGFPADNAAMAVSAAAMRELITVFQFVAGAWRNPAGGVAAGGASGWQAIGNPTGRTSAPFDLASLNANSLVGVLQAQAAWTPGAVAQQFDFVLDVEGA